MKKRECTCDGGGVDWVPCSVCRARIRKISIKQVKGVIFGGKDSRDGEIQRLKAEIEVLREYYNASESVRTWQCNFDHGDDAKNAGVDFGDIHNRYVLATNALKQADKERG